MSEGEKTVLSRMPSKETAKEWIDVVDENDRLIRPELREEFYRRMQTGEKRRENEFFRATAGLAVTPEGKILFFRRQAGHRRFPGALDYSVSGGVQAGESYEVAFRRELKEELSGLREDQPVELLGKLPPDIANGVRWFTEVYRIPIMEAPAFNSRDFSEALLLKPEEFLELLKKEKEENPERTQKADFERILKTYFPS